MPVNAALNELLATLPKEDADVIRAKCEAHPTLGEGWLRQADYDRNLNKVKEERAAETVVVEENNAKMAKWQKWYDDTLPVHQKTVENLKTAEAKVTELNAKILAAADSTGGDVNIEQVNAAVESQIAKLGKAPTQEDINKIISEELEKAKGSFLSETFPATTAVIMDMVDLQFNHQKEFGETLPRKDLAEYMKTHQMNDPVKAYNEMVAPKREEVKTAKIKADAKADAEKEISARFVPGTGVTPLVSNMGHMQAKQVDSKALPDFATTRDAASAAAAELRAEGKA